MNALAVALAVIVAAYFLGILTGLVLAGRGWSDGYKEGYDAGRRV